MKCKFDVSGTRVKGEIIHINPKTIWVEFWGKTGLITIKRHKVKHSVEYIGGLV